ncbi:mitochondrial genome maintenance MGM101-domain-containing protein [Kockovaella imperatae]|uniref:Mitochondrial genome maintenance protein MGM101 n=1 Tax=Kockovaella imperatae TaxID=4999 RepID=A0A1Y1URD3_9TREE|nr:mitochondrial genome maintenance MGM101-domain-containing protein [Kockovaella imperatae]ORX40628.1 mitochondrial genome maintenance MGM101-domain-containing protein [Kockovaella imperatae]
MDEFAPSRPSSSASKSTHSNGQVSPPLKTVPGENSDPLPEVHSDNGTDWTTSFSGIGSAAYPRETIDRLLKPLNPSDIEIKPDGMIYLPEIKYRRVLNQAFGPGGWGMVPRGQTNVSDKLVSREWALVCMGRIAAIARGEQQLYEAIGVPTATEAAKSNALMRCCKDLGIASELWDPQFIRDFKKQYAVEVFAEHVVTKKKKKLWRLKREPKLDYPWKE